MQSRLMLRGTKSVCLKRPAPDRGSLAIDFLNRISRYGDTEPARMGKPAHPRTIRFRAVFHPFIDRFSPFSPFSEKRTEDALHAIAASNAIKT
jgi:hypothetical protein